MYEFWLKFHWSLFLRVQLTHWGRVTHICVNKLTIIGSDNGLLPSHYLNQCWNNVDWTLRNKLQWNLNRNYFIFFQENAFQNVVYEMVVILYRLQCVNSIPALVQIMAGPPGQAPSHYLNHWWLFYRCMCASLGLNELMRSCGIQLRAISQDILKSWLPQRVWK